MPYIAISTSTAMTEEQKDALAADLGRNIGLIPGKLESNLMVNISTGHTMYRGSIKRELAFLDLRCYGMAEFKHKQAYTEAAIAAVKKVTGLPDDAIYLTYGEYGTWGTNGSLK